MWMHFWYNRLSNVLNQCLTSQFKRRYTLINHCSEHVTVWIKITIQKTWISLICFNTDMSGVWCLYCCTAVWPLGVTVPSQKPPCRVWGGGLTIRHSVWVRWNRTGDWFTIRHAVSWLVREVWEAREPSASSSVSAPVPADCRCSTHTHTEGCDVTVYQRNTACFCGIFSLLSAG